MLYVIIMTCKIQIFRKIFYSILGDCEVLVSLQEKLTGGCHGIFIVLSVLLSVRNLSCGWYYYLFTVLGTRVTVQSTLFFITQSS